MSFNGLFLWDIKDGVPTSYSDAQDMETQVSHNASRRCNPAFMAVAKAVEQFTKEAKAYYDDEILNMYSDMTDWMVGFTDPVLSIDHAPEELAIEFSAIIIKAAQEHNLVVLHQEIEVVFLPDGTVLTENTPKIWIDFAKETLAAWAQQLVTLKQENENRDTLPSTSAPLKKLINQIVRARLKEAGITKIKKPEPTVFDVDCGRIQLILAMFPEIDHLYRIEEGIVRVEFLNFMYIFINDFNPINKDKAQDIDNKDSSNLRDFVNFKLSTTPEAFYKDEHETIVYTLLEYENEIHRCVDMFLYFYKVCGSLPMLYEMLVTNKDSKELSLYKQGYKYRGVDYVPEPDTLLVMAKLTKQPDYDELIPYYRQAYIDYSTTIYLNKKESWEKISERDPKYKKIKFHEMANPQATFELEIDKLISYLETLDIDAILNKPPNKALGF
ncbi:hypothetical protein QL982_09990 [Psychrobacter sp. 5A.1]|uniref:hypothetical protein n=2 Tax=unclassified Psychrobacter TaxID=196806 RepID=UPI0025B3B717|nr:hypothetical protein [Psychrobacter sp. 5A.1]MDN3503069.1 hypothetical protein [Psychrobacter sp. 5A.1]